MSKSKFINVRILGHGTRYVDEYINKRNIMKSQPAHMIGQLLVGTGQEGRQLKNVVLWSEGDNSDFLAVLPSGADKDCIEKAEMALVSTAIRFYPMGTEVAVVEEEHIKGTRLRKAHPDEEEIISAGSGEDEESSSNAEEEIPAKKATKKKKK
jgi:hypothetical protein